MKLLGTFTSELLKLGVNVDKIQLKQLYDNLDPRIRRDAKIILLPIAATQGVVYGMDNKTGMPVPFRFSRASSATYFDSSMDIKLAGNDMPRIDYGNYTDGVKLLIEKEKTNFLTGSDFTIASSDRNNWIVTPYTSADFDTDHAIFTIISQGGAARIQRSCTLDSGNHNVSIYGNNHGHRITFGSFINAIVDTQAFLVGDNYRIHWCNFNVTASGNVTIRPYLSSNNGWYDNEQLFVKYIQIEDGAGQTSYIPTTDSPATRSADLLSIDLTNNSEVYIKTSKGDEITITKPAGLWNIHEDISYSDGIEQLIIK